MQRAIARLSSRHRLAAISLYRALLSQSKVLPPDLTAPAKRIVQNKFRDARFWNGSQRLHLHFAAGYEALDLLDNYPRGEERVRKLIDNAVDFIKEPRRRPTRQIKRGRKPLAREHLQANDTPRQPSLGDEPTDTARPRAKCDGRSGSSNVSIFARPLPLSHLSGRRRVPVLYSAQRIPVLRLSPHQPAAISKMIRDRLAKRQRSIDTRDKLAEEEYVARLEDQWDKLLMRVGATREGGPKVSWADAIVDARKENMEKHRLDAEDRREVAGRMEDVVRRERELYEWEEKRKRLRIESRKGFSMDKEGWGIFG
ncbi:hypothetical protein K470DRAFT_258606 [Piedraia hortae CBS 480.64]|uniref:Uncharacterized protein n=1 Tax=Piedraia hortae CBS 480.64 TaxID=1314780 RepID=A0A6A7BYI1_9PEZI|nr:hypothetical protein K470DRAFT_258606 [Piedraia hortae CBS 480.64]